MKLAIFKDASSNFTLVREAKEEQYTDMVRISEYVDVDFPPRAIEERMVLEVAALEKEIEQITAKFAKAVGELKNRKSELLALTDQRHVA